MSNIKLIHIGYPKCGSTFLQMEVFPKIKAVKTSSTTESDEFLLKAVPHIMTLDSIFYDPAFIKDCAEKMNPKINVISYEGFAGFVSLGRGVETATITKRLKNIFPDTKILVVLRNQETIIPSLYTHDVKFGYACDFDKWFKMFEATFRYIFLKYSGLIECYRDIFGKENVKVVFFEELFKKETIKEILDFSGIDSAGLENVDCSSRKNTAYTPLSLSLTLWLNRHFGTKINLGAGFVYCFWRYRISKYVDSISGLFGMKKKNFITSKIDEKLVEWFREDNRKLAEVIGRKLPDKYLL